MTTAAWFGGSLRLGACVGSLLCIGAAATHLTSRRSESRPGPLLVLVGLATALTAVQLVPIPASIAEVIVPTKLALVEDNARALDRAGPAWTVATYDALATSYELAKLCGYFALAWISCRLAAQPAMRTRLATISVAVIGVVLLVVIAHGVTGSREVYGAFATAPGNRLVGPIINSNHVAALFSMGAPLAVGLGMTRAGSTRVVLLTAGFAFSAAALTTGSRGGLMGLVGGLTVLLVAHVARRRSSHDRGRRPGTTTLASTAAMVAIAVAGLAIIGAQTIAGDVRATSLSELQEPHGKYQVWWHSLELIEDNRWLGTGRGAFEVSYHRVQPIGDLSFSHAENSYLQAVIDWGLIGAALLVVALFLVARTALRSCRAGPLEAGATGAVLSIAIHDIVDFSLELPLIAMTTIVAAAIIAPARIGTSPGKTSRRLSLRIVLLAIGAGVAIAAMLGARTPHEVRQEFSSPSSDARHLARAERAWSYHPSDALIAGHLAQALSARGDVRAVSVINRALYLRPTHPGLHQIAARLLARSQRPIQAQVELALALRWADSPQSDSIIADALRLFPKPEEAAKAFPTDPRYLRRLQPLLTRRKEYAVALAYVQRVAAAHPAEPAVQLHLAQAADAAGRHDVLLVAATAAHRAIPSAETAWLLARAVAADHRRPDAIGILRDAPATSDPDLAVRIAVELARQQRLTGELDAARHTLTVAIERARARPVHEAALRRSLAEVEDVAGNRNQARWERERAAELAASN